MYRWHRIMTGLRTVCQVVNCGALGFGDDGGLHGLLRFIRLLVTEVGLHTSIYFQPSSLYMLKRLLWLSQDQVPPLLWINRRYSGCDQELSCKDILAYNTSTHAAWLGKMSQRKFYHFPTLLYQTLHTRSHCVKQN